MKISACIITKNEEKNIAHYLKLLRAHVDEIILVDTGSSDGTIAIAREYNIAVHHFAWRNDFAAAKNFALSKASGDWVVFLDADEFFSSDTVLNLRKLIQKYDKNYDALCSKMINIDVDHENKILDEFYTVRVFKRLPEIVYEGRIHEQISKKSAGELQVKLLREKDLLIYHTGYSALQSESKAKRNLEMLLDELTQTKTPEKYYVYLAEAYFGLGDDKKAVYYAVLDLETGKNESTYASRSYRILIESMKNLAFPFEDRRQIIEKAMADFPALPDFCAEYALLFYQNGEDAKACRFFEKALLLNDAYQGVEPSLLKRSLPLVKQFLAAAQEKLQGKGESLNMEENTYQYAGALYERLKRNESGFVYERALYEIAKALQEYVVLLLRPGVREQGWENRVPASLARVIRRYQGQSPALLPADVSNYQSLLPAVFSAGDRLLIEKYLTISLDFSKEARKEIIRNFEEMQVKSGNNAIIAMTSDFTEEDFQSDVICYTLGKCYFQKCEDKRAEFFFQKALTLGSNERAITSYLKWIAERRANDGKNNCLRHC